MQNIRLSIFRFKILLLAVIAYWFDFLDHYKFSTNYHPESRYSQNMLRLTIMILNHQLEKAQTYNNLRKGYGKEKILQLIKNTNKYTSKYGYDSVTYTTIGVIESHLDNEFSYKDDDIILKFQELKSSIKEVNQLKIKRGGIDVLDFSIEEKDFNLFHKMQSRHSCRNFSQIPLSTTIVIESIKYAMTAPSACNRQSVRAHYYSDKSLIREIILSQKSDFEWCLSATGLFIITSNRQYFRDYYERNQNMFDAGLFSMNLVLGLHNEGVASCFKMAQKSHQIDISTKKIARIPYEEDICVLLLVGLYPESPSIYAKSSRLDLNEILILH